MRPLLLLLAASIVPLVAAPAFAQVGGATEPLKSLPPERAEAYLQGGGMGQARVAELSGFPGPRHVLDLADTLALSPTQTDLARALMAATLSQAVALGRAIVDEERELERLFAADSIDDEALEARVREIGQMNAELRLVHLRAHVAMRAALTPEQAARYAALRHGPGASPGGGPHHPGRASSASPPAPVPSDLTVAALPGYDDARFATATLYQNDGYRVVGFAFRAGQGLPEHAAPVQAFLLVTEGRARVTFGGETHELKAGEGVVLPKDVPHLVEAIEDTRALLTR